MSDQAESLPQIGRNEPCPCGSGKKYKRCCGAGAAPKLSTPATSYPAGMPGGGPGGLAGLDPSQFDPQMMAQFSQMLGRLPKGQLQKLQNLMQKAMNGKDVTREAKDFEQSLPLDLQNLLSNFQMPTTPGASGEADMAGMTELAGAGLPVSSGNVASTLPSGMSEEEARAIVAAAAQEGKISENEATELLKGNPAQESKGISKLWKKISGK
jgi:hypothetical protein